MRRSSGGSSTVTISPCRPGDFTAFAAQWGIPAAAFQAWQGASFVEVANNESIYVFLTCIGDCSTDGDRFVLGMMEDSSTFTVDLF